jgi:hypothetical protein
VAIAYATRRRQIKTIAGKVHGSCKWIGNPVDIRQAHGKAGIDSDDGYSKRYAK